MSARANLTVDELALNNDKLKNLKVSEKYIQPLPQNGAIRKIACRLEMKLTSGAAAPVLTEINVDSFISGIRIKINGREDRIFTNLHIAREAEKYVRGKEPYGTELGTDAATDTTVVRHFNIDFAQNILNRNDISALLQTEQLSSVSLIIETGKLSDIGTNLTLNSAKIDLSAREFYGDGINNAEQKSMQKIYQILQSVNIESGRDNFTSDTQDIDMPARKAILDQILLVKDNGIPSDSLIDRFQYMKSLPNKYVLIDSDYATYHENNLAEFGLTSLTKGFTKINFQALIGNPLGYITGSKSYDVLKLLTPATVVQSEDTIDIFSRYI